MFERIDRWLTLVSRIVSGGALLLMMTLAFVDSIGRLLHRPLLGATEYVEFALMTFFFASLALVVRSDSQIRVGLLCDLYKPRLAQMERLLTAAVELLALGAIAWMLWDQASRLHRFGTLSSFFKMPVAPWIYGAFALSLVALWFALRGFGARRAGPEPRPHAIPDEET